MALNFVGQSSARTQKDPGFFSSLFFRRIEGREPESGSDSAQSR